jgi:hypothetical protein
MQLWDTGYNAAANTGFTGQLDPDGYNTPVPNSAAADARAWPAQLAAYYTQIKTGSQPTSGSNFLPGPLTTATDLAARQQGYTENGVVNHYSFSIGGSGAPWLFVDEGGRVTSCADVLETVTETPANRKTVFVQKDGPGQAWGPDLNTGYYSKVIRTIDWPVCIGQDESGLGVLGPASGSYPIHTGGVPAKLKPGLTAIA